MAKNILITGAAGFIGFNLAKKLFKLPEVIKFAISIVPEEDLAITRGSP